MTIVEAVQVHDDAEVRALGSDESRALAIRLAAGDREALGQMFRLWAPLVHTIALRSLGHEADAEDVTQQVFVSAWRGRHTVRPERGSLAAWLVGITKHRVADVRADRYRAVRDVTAVAGEVAVRPAPSGDDWAERLLIVHELERMGEPRATVLRMSFLEDRRHEDISTALGMPLGTVKSHVRRGLIELRDRLREVERVSPE
jgi:RNA polymerase sigma factor (sigma-70 family)